MVKPTVVKGSKKGKTKVAKEDLNARVLTDKAYQDKVLQNTANHWARLSGFDGDITVVGAHIRKDGSQGKAINLAVDGKLLQVSPKGMEAFPKAFTVVGKGNSARFVNIFRLTKR